jgi:hypothetical protein
MNTVYLLSGPPRTAKTTIMNSLIAETKVQLIAADAIEHGLRNVLTGQPHQMLRHIEISGTAEHKASLTEVGEQKPFANSGTESELVLQAVIGMLDYYRRNMESVAFEGTDFSPLWVSSLDIPGFIIKVAYVGYTDASHIEAVLAHAKNNEHDWINDWLQNEAGVEIKIRNWVKEQSVKCGQLKIEAESHGYPFFDISTQSFEDYKSSVLNHFLQS